MIARVNREAELSPAVVAWLRGLGYSAYAEIGGVIGNSPLDHVGVRWSDESVICVEMKTALTRKVVDQALLRQLVTPLVYVAVPSMPRPKSMAVIREYGLGLLVAGAVVIEPTFEPIHVFKNYGREVLERCRNATEGGVGGLPTLAGDGPAQRCAAAVKAYREANPKARWQDIWRDVPNHYAHARSMQGALRVLLWRLETPEKQLTDATPTP